MSQAYSDPSRENDPHSLPDLETFEVWAGTPYDECPHCAEDYHDEPDHDEHKAEHCGWYWQSCFPGCMPDGDAMGPFPTEAEALADARDGVE